MRSSIPPASMPMAGCSRPCWTSRMRSSAMPSTTPPSSTASASARPSATATAMPIWTTCEAQLEAGQGCAHAAHRHRRRLQHGRRYRPARPHRRARPRATTPLVMVDDSHATGFVGTTRPRLAGALRGGGQDRHPHLDPGQGAGRRLRRLRRRQRRGHRPAAPALAPLSLLQHLRPGHRRRRHRGLRSAGEGR